MKRVFIHTAQRARQIESITFKTVISIVILLFIVAVGYCGPSPEPQPRTDPGSYVDPFQRFLQQKPKPYESRDPTPLPLWIQIPSIIFVLVIICIVAFVAYSKYYVRTLPHTERLRLLGRSQPLEQKLLDSSVTFAYPERDCIFRSNATFTHWTESPCFETLWMCIQYSIQH